jgi:hypothetical protein
LEAAHLTLIPDNTRRVLEGFVEATRGAFARDLTSIVLFGSAAEGKLRPTSDVNLLVLLSAFDRARADCMREPLAVAIAAIRLEAMFVLESELQSAMRAFAVKFADIARRHVILFGIDPFEGASISRADSVARLKQTLLNMVLRLRESYVARGTREEQLAATIAEAAGPLRSCAATLLDLEGTPATSPKDALEQIAASAGAANYLSYITEARQYRPLAPGQAGDALFGLLELGSVMLLRVEAIS